MLIDRAPSHKPVAPAVRPNFGLFALAIVLCTAGVFAVYWAFVHTATGQYIDENAFQQAELNGASTRGPLADFLDQLPVLSLVIAATLVLILAAVRRQWVAVFVAVGSMGAANLTTQFLKNYVFDRPNLGLDTLTFNSLPSGHTTIAASAVGAVFLMTSARWRPLTAFFGATFAVIAGAATFVNMWHRPADIVAALLVVAAWVFVGGAVLHALELRSHADLDSRGLDSLDSRGLHLSAGNSRGVQRSSSGGLWTGLSAAIGSVALVATVILFSLEVQASRSSNEVQPWLSSTFLGGIAFIVATGFLIAAVTTWIFNRSRQR